MHELRRQGERRERQRKRSNAIFLGTVVALAAAVGAAIASSDEDEVTADCVVAAQEVDGSYRIVDDGLCSDSHSSYVRWVYGGNSRGGYVHGATTARPADTTIRTRSGTYISRGGFGSNSRGGGGG
ncbi:hypothetical protein ABZ912_29840 [Nonomuraea angiospora]|uniref:hypothetical protein n=1 Tax=Nonomuraea angiospora TaxID=46172 RepID=UPI0033C2DD1D